MKNRELSIVIPLYNESGGIDKLLQNIFQTFNDPGDMPEIIMVNDGSSDNTADVIRQHPVILINHIERKGYGAALKSGVVKAANNSICIIDADNTYCTGNILDLKGYASDYDMVVGDRKDNKKRPKDHLVVKKLIEKLLSRIFNVHILDINSGLRIMNRQVLIKYLDLLPDGFSFL